MFPKFGQLLQNVLNKGKQKVNNFVQQKTPFVSPEVNNGNNFWGSRPMQNYAQSNTGNFIQGLGEGLDKSIGSYGRLLGEAAYQSGRFAFDPSFRKLVLKGPQSLSYEELQKQSQPRTKFLQPEQIKDRPTTAATALAATSKAELTALGLSNPTNALITAGIGGGLGYGISKYQGLTNQQAYNEAGQGFGYSPVYAGVGKLMTPLENVASNTLLKGGGNFITKVGVKGGINGISNVISNAVFTPITELRNPSKEENITGFLTGLFGTAVAEGSESIFNNLLKRRLSQNSNLTVEQASSEVKQYVRDKAGRFAKQFFGADVKGKYPSEIGYGESNITQVADNKYLSNDQLPDWYAQMDSELGVPKDFTVKQIKLGLSTKELTKAEHDANVAKGIVPDVQKYYINKYDTKGNQTFEEAVSPRKVDIEPNLDTFVSKSNSKDTRIPWVVTEAKTGMAISRPGKTQAEAIASAREVLDNVRRSQGNDVVEKQIQKSIDKYGTTPRYKTSVTHPPLSVPSTKGAESKPVVEEVLKQGKKLEGLKSSSSTRQKEQVLSPQSQTVGNKTEQSPQTLDSIIDNARKEIGEAPKEKPESFKQSVNRLYTQWVDRYNPVVKASEIAEKKLGGVLKTENNPKYLVRRLTGATGIADTRVRRELDPIVEEATKLGIDKADLDVYMANRRLAGFGKIGREVYGADPVKSQAVVDALNVKYGESIGKIADKLYKYQDRGLDEMVEAGFITSDVANVMRGQNPDFAPLQRVMDEVDDYLGLPTRKLMQGSQPIQKLKGSKRQIIPPTESIMTNTFKQRAAIEKNRVARAIANLSEVAPELGFEKVAKSGDDTITVWNNGQKEYWSVGRDIAETAKGLNEENTNTLLKLFTGPASLLRQGATGRNPEFMLPNIIRDQLDAGIASKHGYIPFVDYLSGLKSILTDDEIFKKWESSGAKIDLGSMSGGKSVAEATKRKSMFKVIGDVLDWMGKYSEQPTRVGLFKKAYRATGDELKAVMESRDATVDFARMGNKMKVANSIVPFLNVGVQGFDKIIRSVKDQPLKVALKATIYGVLPTITTTLYNLTQHPEEYAEIPQFERDSNFVIVKGRNENGTVDYITIPKGNILPVISNPVQSFLEYYKGQSKQSFGEFATQFISSTLPVIGDGQSLQEVGIKTIGSNLPQLVKPITENLLNKSFYKYDPKKEQTKEIVPSYLQNKPDYQQAYKFTPELYKKIGQVLDASPLKVQNLLEGYFAGYVKIPANIIDSVKAMSDGKQPEQNKIPLLRRFIKETYPTKETEAKKPVEVKKTTILERLSGEADAAEMPKNIIKYKKGDKDREVDLNAYFIKPTENTGKAIDEEAMSRYKANLSTQINKVYDAYKNGALTEDVATAEIQKLKDLYKEVSGKKKKTGGVSKKKVASIFKEIKKFNKPLTFKLKTTKTTRRRFVSPKLTTKKPDEFVYKGKPFSLKKTSGKATYL